MAMGLVIAVQTQQQDCATVSPQFTQFNEEQSAVCKKAGGLPILVYDSILALGVYRGCQLPCTPTVVHADVEPK